MMSRDEVRRSLETILNSWIGNRAPEVARNSLRIDESRLVVLTDEFVKKHDRLIDQFSMKKGLDPHKEAAIFLKTVVENRFPLHIADDRFNTPEWQERARSDFAISVFTSWLGVRIGDLPNEVTKTIKYLVGPKVSTPLLAFSLIAFYMQTFAQHGLDYGEF